MKQGVKRVAGMMERLRRKKKWAEKAEEIGSNWGTVIVN